jgi:hypothetical protein
MRAFADRQFCSQVFDLAWEIVGAVRIEPAFNPRKAKKNQTLRFWFGGAQKVRKPTGPTAGVLQRAVASGFNLVGRREARAARAAADRAVELNASNSAAHGVLEGWGKAGGIDRKLV